VIPSKIVRVILWMIGALLSFSVMAVSIRELSRGGLSIFEILAIRSGVALLALRDLKTPHIDLSTLAHSVRRLSPGTAVDTLIMALDFLFLLGIVKLDEKGGIRCS